LDSPPIFPRRKKPGNLYFKGVDMIIEVKCKHCGEITKIKVTKLENRIVELEKELRELKAVIKYKEQNSRLNPFADIFK